MPNQEPIAFPDEQLIEIISFRAGEQLTDALKREAESLQLPLGQYIRLILTDYLLRPRGNPDEGSGSNEQVKLRFMITELRRLLIRTETATHGLGLGDPRDETAPLLECAPVGIGRDCANDFPQQSPGG